MIEVLVTCERRSRLVTGAASFCPDWIYDLARFVDRANSWKVLIVDWDILVNQPPLTDHRMREFIHGLPHKNLGVMNGGILGFGKLQSKEEAFGLPQLIANHMGLIFAHAASSIRRRAAFSSL